MDGRPISRIFGNFGVSFFTPLVGSNIAETIYEDIGYTFEQSIVIAFFSAVIYTGLSISRELVKYGEEKWKEQA